jgi:hypothetical protein
MSVWDEITTPNAGKQGKIAHGGVELTPVPLPIGVGVP